MTEQAGVQERAPKPSQPKQSLARQVAAGLRRVLAAAAISLVVLVVLRSYAFEEGQVCREQVASDTGMVTVCGPVGLEDVPALGVLVLVGVLLLLPDMSEVSIPGLVTLKRAVEEQSKQTQALAHEVAALTMRQDTTVNVYPPKLDEAIKNVEKRDRAVEERGARAVAEGVAVFGADDAGGAAPSAERAVVEAAVLRIWNQLEHILPNRGDPEWPVSVNRAWYMVYQPDVEAFRALRNTIVHEPGRLTDEEVQTGYELGRRLLQSYSKFIEGATRQEN